MENGFLGTQLLLTCISHFWVSCLSMLRAIPFEKLVWGCLTSAFQTTSQWFFTIHFIRLLAWFTIYSLNNPPLIGSFYGTALSDGGHLSVTRTQFSDWNNAIWPFRLLVCIITMTPPARLTEESVWIEHFHFYFQQLQQVHIPGLPNPMTMPACGPAAGQRGTPFGSPVRMIGGLVTSSRPPSGLDGPLTSSRPPSAMDVKFDDEVHCRSFCIAVFSPSTWVYYIWFMSKGAVIIMGGGGCVIFENYAH